MDNLTDRAVGALLGAAAGAALGAPYEFGPPLPDDHPVGMIGGGSFGWEPGEWTDDTAMAVPLAQALAAGRSLTDEDTLDQVVAAWASWAQTAKDVGVQTRQVLGRLREPTAAAARAAATELHERTGRTAGNGSLMRTGPVSLGYLADGAEPALATAARTVSELTHYDPEAGDACVLWCLAVRHAVRTGECDLIGQLPWLPATRREVWAARITAAEAGDPRDFAHNGWVVEALQAAWSAVVSGDGLAAVLQRAVRGGRDTDTVAAIAGALAGAGYGASALPEEWLAVLHGWPGLDAEALAGLARAALQRPA